jgi:predicted Zn-dependent peptidase
VQKGFHSLVWPEHMLGKSILGTRENVEALTADDLRAHLERFYTPGRMVLSVCGKFDQDAVVTRAEELFGAFPDPKAAIAENSAAASALSVRFFPKAVEQNQIILGFPGCSGRDPGRYHASLLGTMLGGATSSRLFQRLREELGLVYSVDFFNIHHLEEGVSGISLGLGAKTQRQALEEVLSILREFPATVTEQELRRAKEQTAAGLVMGLESNAARASRTACDVLLYGERTTVEESIAAYRAVTLEETREFAARMLDPAGYTLCVLGETSRKDEKAMRAMAVGGAA